MSDMLADKLAGFGITITTGTVRSAKTTTVTDRVKSALLEAASVLVFVNASDVLVRAFNNAQGEYATVIGDSTYSKGENKGKPRNAAAVATAIAVALDKVEGNAAVFGGEYNENGSVTAFWLHRDADTRETFDVEDALATAIASLDNDNDNEASDN